MFLIRLTISGSKAVFHDQGFDPHHNSLNCQMPFDRLSEANIAATHLVKEFGDDVESIEVNTKLFFDTKYGFESPHENDDRFVFKISLKNKPVSYLDRANLSLDVRSMNEPYQDFTTAFAASIEFIEGVDKDQIIGSEVNTIGYFKQQQKDSC